MTLFLTACSQEEGAEKMSETTFFIIAFSIIFAVIIGVSLGVGIPLLKAQKRQRQQIIEQQNQQSEYLNRAQRRERQFKSKKRK